MSPGRATKLRHTMSVVGLVLWGVSGCPQDDGNGGPSPTARVFNGTVEAQFASREIPLSQRSGSATYRWAGVAENNPDLEAYEGILPGFIEGGTTEVAVDLTPGGNPAASGTGAFSAAGTVTLAGGAVVDLAALTVNLSVEPLGQTGLRFTFTSAAGVQQYDIDFDAQGSAVFSDEQFTASIAITLQTAGSVVDTATGTTTAAREPDPSAAMNVITGTFFGNLNTNYTINDAASGSFTDTFTSATLIGFNAEGFPRNLSLPFYTQTGNVLDPENVESNFTEFVDFFNLDLFEEGESDARTLTVDVETAPGETSQVTYTFTITVIDAATSTTSFRLAYDFRVDFVLNDAGATAVPIGAFLGTIAFEGSLIGDALLYTETVNLDFQATVDGTPMLLSQQSATTTGQLSRQ